MTLGDVTKEKIDRKVAGLYLLGQNIGSDLEKQARSNASWTDRTGNTRRAIHGGADRKSSGTVVYLAHGSIIGLYMEKGTAPHVIRPKNKKALRFTSGGSTIFAKRVNHPGIKARPIIDPTAESNLPRIKRQVRRYWENT